MKNDMQIFHRFPFHKQNRKGEGGWGDNYCVHCCLIASKRKIEKALKISVLI